MKSVLFIVTNLRRTGPINILFDIVRNMDRSLYEIHILTLCAEHGDSSWHEFESEGIRVTSLNLPKGLRFFKVFKLLRPVVTKINPDIVHSMGFRSDVLTVILLKKYPKISTQCNSPFDDYVMTFGYVTGGIMARLTVWALRRYNYSVACSNDLAAKIKPYGVQSVVIFNSVDPFQFLPAFPNEQKPRLKELGLWQDADQVFIFVGVLSQRKQPLVAINAFLLFQSNFSKSAMIVLGDGPLMDECRRISQGKRVFFAGNVKDVRPYLAASDIYISTSLAEGLPVSVIGALAMRLPVILTDIPPHREILAIDERAGILVRPGSAEQTCAAMHRMVELDKQSIGEYARGIVEKELNTESMSRKYQEIYESLLNSTALS